MRNKNAATEVTAQKTQTPIVAKPYRYKNIIMFTPMEFVFLSNSWHKHKKGTLTPCNNVFVIYVSL